MRSPRDLKPTTAVREHGLLNRREVMAGAAALGLAGGVGPLGSSRAFAQTPVRGGTLRIGLIGGGFSNARGSSAASTRSGCPGWTMRTRPPPSATRTRPSGVEAS